MAETVAVEEVQVGWVTTLAVPMVVLDEDTLIRAFGTSLKLEKLAQLEV